MNIICFVCGLKHYVSGFSDKKHLGDLEIKRKTKANVPQAFHSEPFLMDERF
jgi:hypothetical protein